MTNKKLQKTAFISWKGDDLNFRSTLGSGYGFDLSGQPGPENGGSPMEFLLAGAAGCTAMDVASILSKMRQNVTGLDINISGNRAAEHPKVYTTATLEYVVTGKNIDPAAVEKAITLSQEKYCSASVMFKQAGVDVQTSYRIVEE